MSPQQDMLLILVILMQELSCDDETWIGVIGRHGPDEDNAN